MSQPPPPLSNGSRSLVWAGWICSFLSVAVLWKSTWLFPVYTAFWLTAMILAIIILARRHILAGLSLLLVTLLIPPPLLIVLVILRGTTALSNGMDNAYTAATGQSEQSRRAAERKADERLSWEEAHNKPDPAFGTWTVTLWDAGGKVVEHCEAAGFERYGPDDIRFIMPLEDSAPNCRMYRIQGSGNRGEWHPQIGATHGWFEIEARPELKELRKMEFSCGEAESDKPPGRGVFALIPD